MNNGQHRIHKLLDLEVRNIHADNHENRSRRLAVVGPAERRT